MSANSANNEDRIAKLEAIAAQVKACTKCRLHENARNGVPGAGNYAAEIMFIGEGPGENEDLQGLPFVGRSGQYLDYLLNLIGLKREQVFITNVVKHRPPNNRDPMVDEIEACREYLEHQIALIDPLMIATLGRFSMAKFFPGGKISAIHGKPKYAEARAYYPLFHPAAALRNPGLRFDMEADIKRIPEILAEVKTRRAENKPDEPEPEQKDDLPPEQLSLF